MRIDELLKNWTARLAAAGIETPALEAELIYAEAAGLRRGAWLPDAAPSPEAAARGETWLARREKREPLQYIFGCAAFRELELEVTPDVLIPRPETELLVDHALKALPRGGRLLDAGTGSGCIALSAAYERPDARVTAVDASPAALAVAKRNAAKYGLAVAWIESDLLSSVAGGFDVIAANLPYVCEEEYATLAPELRHEPKSALTAPDRGMALIRKLAAQAPAHLNAGGRIFFEVGEGQASVLADELVRAGYDAVEILNDYCGVRRFVAARKA